MPSDKTLTAIFDKNNKLTGFDVRINNGGGKPDIVTEFDLNADGTFTRTQYSQTFDQFEAGNAGKVIQQPQKMTFDAAINLMKAELNVDDFLITRTKGPRQAQFYHLKDAHKEELAKREFQSLGEFETAKKTYAKEDFVKLLNALTNEYHNVDVSTLSPNAQTLAQKFVELSKDGIDEKEQRMLKAQAQVGKIDLLLPLAGSWDKNNKIVDMSMLDAVITENGKSVKVKAHNSR